MAMSQNGTFICHFGTLLAKSGRFSCISGHVPQIAGHSGEKFWDIEKNWDILGKILGHMKELDFGTFCRKISWDILYPNFGTHMCISEGFVLKIWDTQDKLGQFSLNFGDISC